MPRTRIRLLSVLSAALLVPLAAISASAAEGLHWQDCATPGTSPRLQCANLEVPLDRAESTGPKITLKLVRIPASDQSRRIGSLLTNPGGPGGSGVDVIGSGGLQIATPEFAELTRRFDIVGFDPRGVGHSVPVVSCDPAVLYDPSVDRFPDGPAEYARLVTHNRSAGQDCLARTGPLLSHVDTRSAADDVESIRVALGESRISWLGVSYGTELGASYAAKYPGHVRAMVLDGAVDHARPVRRAILEEAAATEDGLRRFAAWCSSSDQCALRGQDVLAGYDTLMRNADAHGVPSRQLGRAATADELAVGVYGYLYVPSAWPALSQALAAAEGTAPDASALTGAMPFGTAAYSPYRAVGCHDFSAPFTGPADLRIMAGLLRSAAPHSWRYSEFWDFASGCVGWPVGPANPPRREPIAGTPPLLVVAGTHDPATPLAWARGLGARIEHTALLTYDGDGHTGLYNSACVRQNEMDYLVNGVLPSLGATCPPDPGTSTGS